MEARAQVALVAFCLAMTSCSAPQPSPPAASTERVAVNAERDSGWVVTAEKDPIDDSPDVTAMLMSADGEKAGIMIVRCRRRKTDLYVVVGQRFGIEDDPHKVTMRLDKGKAWSEQWSLSSGREALFAPYPIILAQDIQNSKRMVFEFEPADSAPVDVDFDVSGADRKLAAVDHACHWPPWK